MAGAGKRAATSDLNHDNWDRAEEPEESGEFRTASRDEIQRRVIRTARRRAHAAAPSASVTPAAEGNKSIFGGFTGFNKAAPSSFDFLSKLTNGSAAKETNGTSKTDGNDWSTTAVFGSPVSSSTGIFSTSPVSSDAKPTAIFNTSSAMSDSKPSSVFGIPSVSPSAPQTFLSPSSISSASAAANNKPTPIFGITPLSSTTGKSVSFGIPPVSNPTTVSSFIMPSVSSSISSSHALNSFSTQSQYRTSTKDSNPQSDANVQVKSKTSKEEYHSKLIALNESVADWIKIHVGENPLCILTPIFKDYQKYLSELHEEHGAPYLNSNGLDQCKDEGKPVDMDKSSNSPRSEKNAALFGKTPAIPFSKSPSISQPNAGFSVPSAALTTPSFSFGIKSSIAQGSMFEDKSKEDSPTSTPSGNSTFLAKSSSSSSIFSNSPGSLFTSKASTGFVTSIAATSTPLSFGINSSPQITLAVTTTPAAVPFSFGLGKPFNFKANIEQKPNENNEENKVDEDEPPKVEFTPIVEENSVFDKKCKIFFKKEGNFVDKGVGTLYVKTVENSSKHQLIVRANTSLGTVLLNIILSESTPTQRMGKNNVMVVCIPTPESKPPPVPVLIRVRNSEEADNLLETLMKYKT